MDFQYLFNYKHCMHVQREVIACGCQYYNMRFDLKGKQALKHLKHVEIKVTKTFSDQQ